MVQQTSDDTGEVEWPYSVGIDAKNVLRLQIPVSNGYIGKRGKKEGHKGKSRVASKRDQ